MLADMAGRMYFRGHFLERRLFVLLQRQLRVFGRKQYGAFPIHIMDQDKRYRKSVQGRINM